MAVNSESAEPLIVDTNSGHLEDGSALRSWEDPGFFDDTPENSGKISDGTAGKFGIVTEDNDDVVEIEQARKPNFNSLLDALEWKLRGLFR